MAPTPTRTTTATEPGRASRPGAGREVLVVLHEPVVGGATLSVLRTLPLLRERGWRFLLWAPRPSELHDYLTEQGWEVHGAERTVGYSLAALRLPPGPRRRLAAMPALLRRAAPTCGRAAPRGRPRELLDDARRGSGLADERRAGRRTPARDDRADDQGHGRPSRDPSALAGGDRCLGRVCGESRDRWLASAGRQRRRRVPGEGRRSRAGRRRAAGRCNGWRAQPPQGHGRLCRGRGDRAGAQAGGQVRARRFRHGSHSTPIGRPACSSEPVPPGSSTSPGPTCQTLLGEVDVFALPSRIDPCPISLLEAMGAGLPVDRGRQRRHSRAARRRQGRRARPARGSGCDGRRDPPPARRPCPGPGARIRGPGASDGDLLDRASGAGIEDAWLAALGR